MPIQELMRLKEPGADGGASPPAIDPELTHREYGETYDVRDSAGGQDEEVSPPERPIPDPDAKPVVDTNPDQGAKKDQAPDRTEAAATAGTLATSAAAEVEAREEVVSDRPEDHRRELSDTQPADNHPEPPTREAEADRTADELGPAAPAEEDEKAATDSDTRSAQTVRATGATAVAHSAEAAVATSAIETPSPRDHDGAAGESEAPAPADDASGDETAALSDTTTPEADDTEPEPAESGAGHQNGGNDDHGNGPRETLQGEGGEDEESTRRRPADRRPDSGDRRIVPVGWRLPAADTLAQHDYGIRQGLVPAGHPVLRHVAEEVLPGEVTSREVVEILGRMYHVITSMKEVGRPIVGLAAPQIGEAAQIVLVPRQPDSEDVGFGEFMPVINPQFTAHDGPQMVVPHGCFSANEVFARLPSAASGELTGLDAHGEPLHDPATGEPRLVRTGFNAVVDQHETRHLEGVRAADVAIEIGQQLDYRPPSETARYRAFFAAQQQDPNTPEWDLPYPDEQWRAVTSGEFRLEDYMDR